MNDEKFKNLLSRDHSCPKTPENEWEIIESELSTSRSSIMNTSLKPKMVLSYGLAFALVFFFIFDIKEKRFESKEAEVVEYLLDGSYFDSEEESYTWVN